MPSIHRQTSLPTSQAIGIAWKSLRLRLGRSILVTSGIVLALAFLMAILSQGAITHSLRNYASTRPLGASVEDLRPRQQLAARLKSNGVPTTPDEIQSSGLQTRWLVSLALLVAFVGILNAMLMSVTERFREIGTMKCLGALDSFIIKLFLIESLFQGLVGTVIGILLGLALSLLAQLYTYGPIALQLIPIHDLLTGVALCFAIGITLTIAGALYPAWQAAKMQPIEAMRVET
ncbi:MAG TPA: FtsX-like permease family protein [Tepidisphaeraceae bacterium]|jgi:predicted lysophospholipase L1 biosynthesis ABC-type transport system permease subunit